MDKPKVLIVGAGIAALALAAGLERHGVTPTIVEVAESILTRGLDLLLTNNALLPLRRIALDDEIIKNGMVQEHFVNVDPAGTPISDYDFRPLNVKYAPNLSVTPCGPHGWIASRHPIAHSARDDDYVCTAIGRGKG